MYINTFVNDANLTENMLISSMVGRDFEKSIYSKKRSTVPADAEIVFDAQNFTKGKTVMNASLGVRRGEIMGVFGLEGSGTYEFSRMMFGLHGKDTGRILFEGKEIKPITPTVMIEKGIIFLNNNRKDAGLLFNMSIADNMAIPVIDRLTKGALLSRKAMENYTLVCGPVFHRAELNLRQASSLSGGNQQKVMLSVCLGTKPKFLIVNEPTRGIDVGAKLEILRLLNEIVNTGVSVLCFSSICRSSFAFDRIADERGTDCGVIDATISAKTA